MFAYFNKALRKSWRNLLNVFWFVPGLVSLLGPLLALVFLTVDYHVGRAEKLLIFSGGSAEASTILSTLAGSLITVVGLTFSITIVVLQLVSSQYTPRALRGFLQDRLTQVVAGGFAAISAYCLIVLMTVHDSSSPDQGFLPAISITVAMGLGFLGLVLLLIFIHHAGSVIQVADITARLATQTMQAIDLQSRGWMSEPLEEEGSPLMQTRHKKEVPAQLHATHAGYVQRIALSHLIKDLRHSPGLYLHLLVCPGDFVTEETVIAEVWPAEAAEAACRRAIYHSVSVEHERDVTQDARFGVRQLADIALRALSPAVNDPTTAVLCIQYLQAVFEHLVRRQPQPGIFHFANGASILELRQPAFQEYLEVFAELGQYTGGNVRVMTALLTALSTLMQIVAALNLQEYQDLLTRTTSTLAAKSKIAID
jgi:uncharacterized membrane protein